RRASQADGSAAGGSDGAGGREGRRVAAIASRNRRVGKGAFAPCPPSLAPVQERWARFALPTLRELRRATSVALHLPSNAEHEIAQPDRTGVHLGACRIEQILLVDPGIERRGDRLQRQLPC